jgi:trans-aconitate methyltransferase
MSDDAGSWPAEVFDRLYAADPDPWRYETSPYERDKYAATLGALPDALIGAALELACSIGVMTRQLAERCDSLLALDGAEAALATARRRCADLPQVSFRHARLPAGLPPSPGGGWDLVVASELLYFLSPADILLLASSLCGASAPTGSILLVNWTGDTDTPCTGEQAASLFVECCLDAGFRHALLQRHAEPDGRYRLDRLDRVPAPA